MVRDCRVYPDGEGGVGEQWAEGYSEAVFDTDTDLISRRIPAIIEPESAPA